MNMNQLKINEMLVFTYALITVKPIRTEGGTERRITGEGLRKSILKPCSYGHKPRLSVAEVTNTGYPKEGSIMRDFTSPPRSTNT